MNDPTGTLLGVFAKYWQPGRVKTRLAASIGGEAAAALHRAFLETTIERLDGLADEQVVAYSPAESHREFLRMLPDGWKLQPQAAGTLGQRMEDFFETAFAQGTRRVVLVGSDAPSLPIDCVARAFDALERSAVVIGPARDGGYYLVGARDRTPPVFRNVEWSTPRVWEQTLDGLHAAGFCEGSGYSVLPEWFDVDTLDDLRRFQDTLAADGGPSGPLARLAAVVEQVTARGG